MATVADVRVKIGVDLQNFNRGMTNVTKGLDKVGKQMRATGKSLSLGLTAPILALGAKSVQLFDKQAKALAQVETAVRSTGGAAQLSVQQLTEQASALQSQTIFGDEEILQRVTANLLTFTSIAGDEFVRTQAVVLDLATRMGTDLTSATLQLGKALNDPVANLGALSRAGIQFSNEQKEVIKSLVETGQKAEAQRVILEELEVQFGGAAQAAAEAGAGGLQQLQNRLGDLGESIGGLILPSVLELADKISGVVDFLQNLSPETKKTAIAFVGMAAALGPILFILGGVAASISAIFSAMTLVAGLINPWTLAFAALAAIGIAIYRNWDAVKQAFVGTWTAIKDLITNIKDNFIGTWVGIFKSAEQAIKGDFEGAWKTLKQTTADGASGVVDQFSTFATDVGGAIAPAAVALAFDPFALGDPFKTFKDSAKANLNTDVDSVSNSADAASTALGNIKTKVGNIEALAPSFKTLEDALSGAEVSSDDVDDALNKIAPSVAGVEGLAPDFGTLTRALASETPADESLVVMSGNAVSGIKGIGDEVIKLEGVKPDFSSLNTAIQESAGLVESIFDEIPDTLTMPEGYEDIIKDVIPDKDESHRWGTFVVNMANLAHHSGRVKGHVYNIGRYFDDVQGALDKLGFGNTFISDVVDLARDVTTIFGGFDALVQLMQAETWVNAWTDFWGMLKDIWSVITFIFAGIRGIFTAQSALNTGGTPGLGGIGTGGGMGTGGAPVSGGDAANAGGWASVVAFFANTIRQMLPQQYGGLTDQQIWELTFSGGGVNPGGIDLGGGVLNPDFPNPFNSPFRNPVDQMGRGSQVINVHLDGQTIATATMPYWSQELEIYGTNR